MLTTLISLAVLAPSQEPLIHPAFVKTPEQFQEAWDLGIKECKKQSNLDRRLKDTRQTIGTYRTHLLRSEPSSFVYYIPPEIVAYYESFQAARSYTPEEKVTKLKEELIPGTKQTFGSVTFYTSITLMPMFNNGRVTRDANPRDLRDVRVVLKVGDRIIQPEGKQPGNLLESQGSGTSAYYMPRFAYSRTNTSATAQASGSGGYAYGTAKGTSTTVTAYQEYRENDYNWYHGDFMIQFKIVDAEGKPLITDKDKEMTLLVIYGESERKATYKLADLVSPFN